MTAQRQELGLSALDTTREACCEVTPVTPSSCCKPSPEAHSEHGNPDCSPLTSKPARPQSTHHHDAPLHVLRQRSFKEKGEKSSPKKILRELSFDPDVKWGNDAPSPTTAKSPVFGMSMSRSFSVKPRNAEDRAMSMSMSISDLANYVSEAPLSPTRRPEQDAKHHGPARHLKRSCSWSMGMRASGSQKFQQPTLPESDLGPKTTAKLKKHVQWADEQEVLYFADAEGIVQSISFFVFGVLKLDDAVLKRIHDAVPEFLNFLIPVQEKPHSVKTAPGKLEDYTLPEYDEATEKQLAENLRFAKKRLHDHQVDLILEDDDDTTNGWFASHMGIHGADPEEWVVYNAELAKETIPEIYDEILERDRLRLLASAVKKWLCGIKSCAAEQEPCADAAPGMGDRSSSQLEITDSVSEDGGQESRVLKPGGSGHDCSA